MLIQYQDSEFALLGVRMDFLLLIQQCNVLADVRIAIMEIKQIINVFNYALHSTQIKSQIYVQILVQQALQQIITLIHVRLSANMANIKKIKYVYQHALMGYMLII
mgnify:CR=1 FL=1